MSIHAVLGKPGAGKSYEAVQRAYDAVSSGRCVVTNLPLNMEHGFWKQAAADDLLVLYKSTKTKKPEDIDHFGHWLGWAAFQNEEKPFHREVGDADGKSADLIGPLVIVDEAMITFQAMIRMKRKKDDWENFMSFTATHRHDLIDIIVMFHDHGQCDTQLKQVIERWHHVVNTSEMSGLNTYQVKTANKGYVVGSSGFIDKKNGKFKSSIFELYDSYSEGTGKATKGKKKETGLKRSRPIWLRWWAILILVCLLIIPYAAYKTVKGIGGVVSIDESEVPALTGQQSQSMPTPEPVLVQAPLDADPFVVTNQTAARLGWPDPSVPLIGFDNENFYFKDGSRINLQADIVMNGWKVAEVLLCRAVLIKPSAPDRPLEMMEYTCEKGH